MREKTERKKTKRKKGNGLRRAALDVIIVASLAIALLSAYKIYEIIRNYKTDQKTYSVIQSETETVGRIDWDKLGDINSDVVGWIRLEGTNIDYPIVKSHDNDEYLHTLFDGNWGNAGCIFVDCATDDPFNQFNTVVYGHHMKDGSMFENLKYYKEADYAADHGKLELFTPNEDYDLEVAAFLNCPADSKIYSSNIGGDGRIDYLKAIEDYAEYTTDIKLNENDKIVILSTCAYEYEDARYVVVGKLVPCE